MERRPESGNNSKRNIASRHRMSEFDRAMTTKPLRRTLPLLPLALLLLLTPRLVTRAEDGSAERLTAEVNAELAAWSTARVDAGLALHAEELGQDDRATAGAGRTLEALRTSRVALLLVAERADDEVEARRAWAGPTRDQIATTAGDLADPDAAEEVSLLDGAVTAALASGAGVLVVPEASDGALTPQLTDGLGALLRW